MAIEKLRTNYKDDILDTSVSASRRYNMTTNSDGTISLEDVSTYEQLGDNYGATDINKLNTSVNALIDGTSNINNTPDSQKKVSYAESAGTAQSSATASYATTAGEATNATNATNASHASNASNADNAVNAQNASKLSTARKINGVDFDGTKDIAVQDNTKISKNEDFVLINRQILTFQNNICSISDDRITEDSLADVYFTSDTILNAEKAVVTVETYNGRVELTAGRTPDGQIVATIKIRVVGE